MSAVIAFEPCAGLAAKEQLENFVRYCRHGLTVFGELDWDAHSWDISADIKFSGIETKVSVRFTRLGVDKSTWRSVPAMTAPYSDFAKSFIRYRFGVNPTRNITSYAMFALRALEKALIQEQVYEVHLVQAATFDAALAIATQKWRASVYAVGNWLEEIAEFLNNKELVDRRFSWISSASPKRREVDRTGPEGHRRRAELLPSDRALEALAHSFNLAVEPRDVLTASIGAILVCAPSRVNEVVTVGHDAQVFERRDGMKDYGWRWRPAKGADPEIKWIVGTMADIAKTAFSRLLAITDDARRVAAWYETHPKSMYLPAEYEYLRGSDQINVAEIEALLGSSKGEGTSVLKTLKIPFEIRAASSGLNPKFHRNAFVQFEDLQAGVLRQLPLDFPILDRRTGLTYSQALLIVPYKFFKSKHSSKVMFEPVTIDKVMKNFGNLSKPSETSIFTRLNFTEDDGSPIRLRTHQLRHWLDMLARIGGLSEIEIAMWAGRRNIAQNASYDLMTTEQMLEKTRKATGAVPASIERLVNAPVSRSVLATRDHATTHTTEYGACHHDFVMSPCVRHADHLNCHEHSYTKGDEAKTEMIRSVLIATELQTAKSTAALADGYENAGRWWDHHNKMVLRLRQFVSILDDPSIPIGSIIRMSVDGEYSTIGLTLQTYVALSAVKRSLAIASARASQAAGESGIKHDC